jgi:hypothetical protein
MGADLTLQDVTIREKPTKAFWTKLQKALDKKVKHMTKEELVAWDETITGNNDPEESIDILRAKALTVISEAMNDLKCVCRDMTYIRLPIYAYDANGLMLGLPKIEKYYTIYLAGGMSHGDSPGETYEDFYKLNMLFPDYRYIDEVLDE